MTAVFPGAIWAPTTKVDNVDDVMAAHMNDAQNEIVAVETIVQAVRDPNPVVNGTPIIWQRGTSFAAMATAALSADCWMYLVAGAAVHTGSQSTTVPTVAEAGVKIPYSIKYDCTTVDATIAAADYVQVRAAIEGYNWLHLAQRIFTVGFWVRDTKTGIHCFSVRNAGADRSYVAEYTIATTNTWEYKTITVSASPTAGTWDYINGVGVYLTWALAAGTDFQTTAGTWQTGNYLATANQVNAVDSTSNDFYITGVTITPGPYARPPVIPDYQHELSRAMRRAWVLDASSNTATIFNGSKYDASNCIVIGPTPVPMRVAPTGANFSHNITGYTAGAPGTTTVALFDLGTAAFKTIVGALTVTATANTQQVSMNLAAGTSFSGTAGHVCQLRIGPSVVAIFAADI